MGRGQPLGDQPKAHLRDADAAGVAVVNEDRWRTDLRVVGRADAADVVAIAEGEERQKPDARVLDRVDAAR